MQKLSQLNHYLGSLRFNTYDFIAAMFIGIGAATQSVLPFAVVFGMLLLSLTHPGKE